jgi:Cysteine dioxygenase type I
VSAQPVPTVPAGGVPARAAHAIDTMADGSVLEQLPDHALGQDELQHLVASIASDPELWRDHVAFDDDVRHYVCLHRDAHVDVWVLCWTPRNDTGWHDHDISSGAVAVVQGRLVERNLAVGTPIVSTVVGAGQVFGFGPDHIHRLTGVDAGSVSIHAYSPPLWRMGQYAVSADGVLRRASVSYADELRPVDDMEPTELPAQVAVTCA